MTSAEFKTVDAGEEEEQFNYKVEEFHKSPKSVYFVNMETIYSDTYPAKFNEELVRMLVKLYSKEGEWVADPMNGSGTVPLIAAKLGRRGWGQDVNPKAIAVAEEKRDKYGISPSFCQFHLGDSRVGLGFRAVDLYRQAGLVLTSPPFGVKAIVGTKKQYSNESADITNAPDYPAWRAGLKAIMTHCYEILMPGRLMIVEIRPRSVEGHDQPMDLWIQNDAEAIGFDRWSRMLEIVDPWRMYTVKDKENDFVKPYPGHADLLMFKKPASAVNAKLI